MRRFLRDLTFCLLYDAGIGILSLFAGQALPRSWLRDGGRRPFRPCRWERDGAAYRRIGVHRWKDRMIDMSRLCGFMIPKTLKTRKSVAELDDLIRETRVAELTHGTLAGLGFVPCLFRRSGWTVLFACLYAVGNLPYVIIQRYNRPRLERLRRRAAARIEAPPAGSQTPGERQG